MASSFNFLPVIDHSSRTYRSGLATQNDVSFSCASGLSNALLNFGSTVRSSLPNERTIVQSGATTCSGRPKRCGVGICVATTIVSPRSSKTSGLPTTLHCSIRMNRPVESNNDMSPSRSPTITESALLTTNVGCLNSPGPGPRPPTVPTRWPRESKTITNPDSVPVLTYAWPSAPDSALNGICMSVVSPRASDWNASRVVRTPPVSVPHAEANTVSTANTRHCPGGLLCRPTPTAHFAMHASRLSCANERLRSRLWFQHDAGSGLLGKERPPTGTYPPVHSWGSSAFSPPSGNSRTLATTCGSTAAATDQSMSSRSAD